MTASQRDRPEYSRDRLPMVLGTVTQGADGLRKRWGPEGGLSGAANPPGRCKIDQRGRAAPAATASISISNAGLTSALTMIVAEPGRASPKCLARCCAGGDHIVRANEISGDLHQIRPPFRHQRGSR